MRRDPGEQSRVLQFAGGQCRLGSSLPGEGLGSAQLRRATPVGALEVPLQRSVLPDRVVPEQRERPAGDEPFVSQQSPATGLQEVPGLSGEHEVEAGTGPRPGLEGRHLHRHPGERRAVPDGQGRHVGAGLQGEDFQPVARERGGGLPGSCTDPQGPSRRRGAETEDRLDQGLRIAGPGAVVEVGNLAEDPCLLTAFYGSSGVPDRGRGANRDACGSFFLQNRASYATFCRKNVPAGGGAQSGGSNRGAREGIAAVPRLMAK